MGIFSLATQYFYITQMTLQYSYLHNFFSTICITSFLSYKFYHTYLYTIQLLLTHFIHKSYYYSFSSVTLIFITCQPCHPIIDNLPLDSCHHYISNSSTHNIDDSPLDLCHKSNFIEELVGINLSIDLNFESIGPYPFRNVYPMMTRSKHEIVKPKAHVANIILPDPI